MLNKPVLCSCFPQGNGLFILLYLRDEKQRQLHNFLKLCSVNALEQNKATNKKLLFSLPHTICIIVFFFFYLYWFRKISTTHYEAMTEPFSFLSASVG